MIVMTNKTISALQAGQTAWDKEVAGFGARKQTAAGKVSFILKTRIDGKQKKFTLGKFGILTIDAARKQALELLREIQQRRFAKIKLKTIERPTARPTSEQ